MSNASMRFDISSWRLSNSGRSRVSAPDDPSFFMPVFPKTSETAHPLGTDFDILAR